MVSNPIHNSDKVLADILCLSHAPCLDEVLVAPGIREIRCFPSVVYHEQCWMITFQLVKFSHLRIRLGLFLLRSVEDRLDT